MSGNSTGTADRRLTRGYASSKNLELRLSNLNFSAPHIVILTIPKICAVLRPRELTRL
jgi:hypothetical protein